MYEMYEIRYENDDVGYFDGLLDEAIECAKELCGEGEEWAVFSETGELVAKSDGYKLSKERALKAIEAHIDAIQKVAASLRFDKAINIGVFKDSAFAFMLDDEGNSVFDVYKYGGEWVGLS